MGLEACDPLERSRERDVRPLQERLEGDARFGSALGKDALSLAPENLHERLKWPGLASGEPVMMGSGVVGSGARLHIHQEFMCPRLSIEIPVRRWSA